jgi:hypothetical protein
MLMLTSKLQQQHDKDHQQQHPQAKSTVDAHANIQAAATTWQGPPPTTSTSNKNINKQNKHQQPGHQEEDEKQWPPQHKATSKNNFKMFIHCLYYFHKNCCHPLPVPHLLVPADAFWYYHLHPVQ